MTIYSPSFILFNILHPPSLFTCFTCLCFVVDIVNKSRLQYEGTLKYPGESVTGLEFWLWKMQQGSYIAEEDSRWGHQHEHRQILAIPLHMHSAFPT